MATGELVSDRLNRLGDGGDVLVVSPHPDDAVLSAWSELRGSPRPSIVTVCTATPAAGTRGPFDEVIGVTDSASLVVERVAEDARALAMAGCTSVGLGFLDAQYRDGPLDAQELRAAVDRAADGATRLVTPAGIGRHPDHVAVREAVLAVGAERAVAVSLVADLPYAVWAGWPHWVTGREPRPYLVPEARWRADLEACSVPIDLRAARVVVFAPDEMMAKLDALQRYRTQFETLNGGPLDRLRNPEILGFEVAWDVNPRG